MEELAELTLLESQPSLPPVLSINEILHLIFKELSNSDCARAALVCRTWLEPALDCLWKDLYEDWDIGFPQADWAWFQSYSRRVHSISYDGGWYEGCGFALEHMNPDVPVKLLYYVAMNQGAYVLPRAQAIHWDATEDRELQLLISLTSPSIKEFDIDVWECTLGASSRLLRALRFILPRDLRIFRFKSDLDKTPIEDVTAIVRQQGSLQILKLPSCALDPVMFKPTLRVLEAYCAVDSGRTLQQVLILYCIPQSLSMLTLNIQADGIRRKATSKLWGMPGPS
ncbi:hypothetical protein FRC00_001223 [Tulasnella sp. 408]|nr:hypothetical protein FRC00_001223 [Tulasnella sp. 408]